MSPRLAAYLEQSAALRSRAQYWRLVATIALAVFGQILATMAVFGAYSWFVARATGTPYGLIFADVSRLRAPEAIILFLSTFSGAILMVFAALRLLHGARPGFFYAPGGRFNWPGFARAAGLVFAIGAVGVGAGGLIDGYDANQPPAIWILWLLPALAVIFLQVFTEEFIFRGYLQSHLASRFRNPVIWMGLPAVAFGALHWQPGLFGSNAILVVIAATLMGLVTGHVTARTGGISHAVGLHFANNCIGLLFVALPGDLAGLSLFLQRIDLTDAPALRVSLLTNIAVILVAYGIYLLVIRRRDARLQ